MAENRVCRFNGKCTKGLKCPFIHTKDGNTPVDNSKPKKPCRFGVNCRNQSECKFDHSSSTTDQLTTTLEDLKLSELKENVVVRSRDSSVSSTSTQDSRIKKKCRFGINCRNQPNCEFDHTIQDDKTSSVMVPEMMKQIQYELNNNVPAVRHEHERRIGSLELKLDDDIEDLITRNLLQEHHAQLETFNSIIESYAHASVPLNDYTAKLRLGGIRREIKRLKSHLPIYARRDQLLDTIRSNRVLILKADTGSGKSTQLVQYLVDGGLAENGEIVCTQPRRLAARALASRVAEEFGCKVGEEVGFRIGAIKPQVSDKTKIRFVTDSILLNEYVNDPTLSKYSIVIIDEAHERRVDTDLLFGIMKLCLERRSDLKLIVMSATLDTDLLGNYYRNSILVEVPGRTYPIEDEYINDDIENYVEASIAKTIEIHNSKVPGDILVFLTGPDEIDRAVEDVERKLKDTAIVLPLHGKLIEADTKRVFEVTPKDKRKIIFSTNVAETSVTIDGICHVVETGMVKESMWDEKRHMQVLKIGTITQSSVKQRRGRAGRTAPGKCYHLYTEEMYNSFDICPRAEIRCIQPSLAVLKLKYLGVVDDIEKFDWLEAPSLESIRDAIQSLKWLNALDHQTNKITETGRFMAELGLSPMLSAMILKGIEMSCEGPIIALAGMLSISQILWWRSKDADLRQLADEKRAYFAHDNDQGGDHIQLLKIFLQWEPIEREKRSKWCRDNMINGKAMNIALEFVHETYRQLKKKIFDFKTLIFNQDLVDKILLCVTGGYFQNLALSNGSLKAGYQLISAENINAQVYRTSTITYGKNPSKYVIYHEILNLNGTNCMTIISPIQYEWLPKLWLNSLRQQPTDLIFVDHIFQNIGPTLMYACLGKHCAKKQQLEDLLNIVLDVNYEESTLTIWCQKQKLNNAKLYLEKLLKFERTKLMKEIEEYEIIGTTRVILGEGGQPLLVLTKDEYIQVMAKSLPTNVTEEDIEKKFNQLSPTVRYVNIQQTNNHSTTASIIYYKTLEAQNAVVRLTNEIWNGWNLIVSPSYHHTSIHNSSQNCKLEVRWFLTESECQGKIIFHQKESAEKALQIIQKQFQCQCRLEMISIYPTIRCQWLIEKHNGQAFIDFDTSEQADIYVKKQKIESMNILSSKQKNTSIYVRNIPYEYDEEDLKEIFPNSKIIKLQFQTKINQLEKFDEIKFNINRLFSQYRSFLTDKTTIQPSKFGGRVEVLVEFTDENEAKAIVQEMNGRTGYINTGKIRLSLNRRTARNADEYILKLSKLSPDIIEEDLLEILKQNHLADNLSYIGIFRKKLNQNQTSGQNSPNNFQLQSELNKLRSLFTSQTYFHSEPEVDIRPATEDGRVTALIIYNNPHDVTTAMELYKDPKRKHLYQFNQYKLYLIPRNDYVIELNRSLVKAIPDKIEQAIDDIRNMNLFNIQIFKKELNKNEKKITRIHIQGSDNLQITKARIVFERLMKGLEFRFYDSSWVSIMFSADGKKFLQSLQESTKTYIWWNWSSNVLRIFGSDNASNEAYRKIDEFIQDRLKNKKYSIDISIPQGYLRQCLRNSNKIKDFANEQTTIEINMIKRFIRISGEQIQIKICEDQIRRYLSTFEQTISIKNNQSNNTECPLCCDICESPYKLQQCGHTYCRGCLTNFFETRFDSTMTIKQFKLSCPIDTCNTSCLIRDIKSILGAEKMTRLAKAAFQIYLKQPNIDLAQCVGIDCIQVYHPSKNSSKYTCDQCVKDYCIPCQTEYHDGISCDEHQKLLVKRRDEELLKENLGLLAIKKCPKCKVLIEKIAGCNAMKCTQCTIAFCWLCEMTDPNDAHQHFLDKSKICYGKTFT